MTGSVVVGGVYARAGRGTLAFLSIVEGVTERYVQDNRTGLNAHYS